MKHTYGYHIHSQTKAIDVVCGMEIEPNDIVSHYHGKAYFFCSEHCKQHFDKSPEKYLGE